MFLSDKNWCLDLISLLNTFHYLFQWKINRSPNLLSNHTLFITRKSWWPIIYTVRIRWKVSLSLRSSSILVLGKDAWQTVTSMPAFLLRLLVSLARIAETVHSSVSSWMLGLRTSLRSIKSTSWSTSHLMLRSIPSVRSTSSQQGCSKIISLVRWAHTSPISCLTTSISSKP